MDLEKNWKLICGINKANQTLIVARMRIQSGYTFDNKEQLLEASKQLQQVIEDLNTLSLHI